MLRNVAVLTGVGMLRAIDEAITIREDAALESRMRRATCVRAHDNTSAPQGSEDGAIRRAHERTNCAGAQAIDDVPLPQPFCVAQSRAALCCLCAGIAAIHALRSTAGVFGKVFAAVQTGQRYRHSLLLRAVTLS